MKSQEQSEAVTQRLRAVAGHCEGFGFGFYPK